MKENQSDNFDCIKNKILLCGKMHLIHFFQDITQMLFHWVFTHSVWIPTHLFLPPSSAFPVFSPQFLF